MSDEQRLSGALQENILTLLCFNDRYCQQVRAAVTPQLFESSVFREVAGLAIDFIDQYREAIKDHLPDHLEGILAGDDQRKALTYRRLLDNLFSARDSINAEFVLAQLHKFVRQQTYKTAAVRIVEALEDGRVDQAELEMQKALSTQVNVFSPGLNMSDSNQVSSLMDELEEPGFDLGIPALDDRGLIPRRKELTMFLAPRGRGKSWFCVFCAKMALIQRWTVVVITLEMSEKRYGARFLQAFFSLTRREGETRVARLVTDRSGGLSDIIHERIERMALTDEGIKDFVARRVKREFRKRPPLIIKQFPTQGLTIEMLEAYLDNLMRHQGITPDLLVVDYPDLMQHSTDNKRVEIGLIVERLRGIAVSRNCAVIAPSQGTRQSETARVVGTDQFAEDISKLATADVVYTYSQTAEEKALGLARLMAGKGRNEADGFTVLMTQAYAVGQFCLESLLLKPADYWPIVEPKPRKGDDD